MDARSAGLLIALAGVVVVAVGLLVATGLLGWFGRLPGDLRYESDGLRIYAPIVSMLVVSLVLTVALAIARRLF